MQILRNPIIDTNMLHQVWGTKIFQDTLKFIIYCWTRRNTIGHDKEGDPTGKDL
jgi:hypothetical protein